MFPNITNFEQLRPLLESVEELRAIYNPEYGIVTAAYMVAFADTFQGDDAALRREFRGITFDIETGEILARPYHKFHNLCENEQTQLDQIDFSRPHVVMDKLDGSMVFPVISKKGLTLLTKRGISDVSKVATKVLQDHHRNFCLAMIERGLTPIFEYVAPSNRIVVQYDDVELIITAIRENVSGDYLSRSEILELGSAYGIPVVGVSKTITKIADWVEIVRDMEGVEGFVIAFPDGSRYKAKTDWYRAIHSAVDGLRFEKDVVRFICEDVIDDVKAAVTVEVRGALDRFHVDFFSEINKFIDTLYASAQSLVDQGLNQRDAALSLKGNPLQGLVMNCYRQLVANKIDREILIKSIIHMISLKTGSGPNLELVRNFFKISWYDYIRGITSLTTVGDDD